MLPAPRLPESHPPRAGRSAAPRSPRPQRSASWWPRLRCPRIPSGWSLAIMLTFFLSSSWSPALLQSVKAFAGLSEEVAHSAQAVLRAGTNATVLATEVAIQLKQRAATIIDEAWTGVDLRNTVANVSALRWYQWHGTDLTDLASTELGSQMLDIPSAQRRLLLVAIRGVSERLPFVTDSRRFFSSNTTYMEFDFQVRFFPNGFVGVQYYFGSVSFSPQWSNPVWEVMGCDVSVALGPLGRQIHLALEDVSPVKWRHQDLPVPEANSMPRRRHGWVGIWPFHGDGSLAPPSPRAKGGAKTGGTSPRCS